MVLEAFSHLMLVLKTLLIPLKMNVLFKNIFTKMVSTQWHQIFSLNHAREKNEKNSISI